MAANVEVKRKLKEEIALPDGVTASVSNSILALKGPRGDLSRNFASANASISIEGGKVTVNALKGSKKEKKLLGSMRAHIDNMIRGIVGGHVYRMKVCYTHFPITLSVSGRKLTVKNFLGEKSPREVELPENVKAKVEGPELVIESSDKEAAGRAAASVEQLTKRANYDTRVFADGIYITMKDGKEIK
ncbi:50S ribosomal protein L6 [Candidatus Woesearchaeota archaeon]|nr:50S ribosomal protein L6 [Candidatus Woesearchaeota archaeon]